MKALFTLVLLMVILTCFGQIKKPAYAINNNGDTLRGWVNYKGWETNPTVVIFYNSEKNNGRPLQVNDIRQ